MKEHSLNIRCSSCHAVQDVYSKIDDNNRGPEPGDYSVCSECSAILQFTAHMKFRVVTAKELRAMPAKQSCTLHIASLAAKLYKGE